MQDLRCLLRFPENLLAMNLAGVHKVCVLSN